MVVRIRALDGTCRRAAAAAFISCTALLAPAAAHAQAASPASALGTAKPAIAAPATASQSAAAQAAEERLKGDQSRTRFVIGLERSTDFQVSSLSSPNRVIVELPDVKMHLPLHSGDKPVGLVKSFRGGLSAPGRSRVVIDVTVPVVVESAMIEKAKDGKSHRLVLDIVPVEAASRLPAIARKPFKALAGALGLGASNVQPPLPKPAERPEVKAAKAYKPVIVIDPGHGGHDSGAQKWGTVEKDVVLAFSLVLRDKLTATGRYKVAMTRDTDKFVDLDARRDFGDKSNAALFIAVHADYAGANARGATIYSLRDAVARDLKRSAKGEVSENVLSAKEVAAMRHAEADVGEVKSILADLAQRVVESNAPNTSDFSRSVIDTMGATTSMHNNPDRSAAFRVLKTAKVPAVLIELAYVSNQQDAKNLKSDQWRDKVSGSIMTAIDNYFSNQMARLPM